MGTGCPPPRLAMLRCRLLHHLPHARRRLLPGEQPGARQALARERLTQGTVLHQALDPLGNRLNVIRVDQQCGVPYDLRQGGDVRRDHRRATRHGFQRRQPEAFVERRAHQGDGPPVIGRKFSVCQLTRIVHTVGHTQGRNLLLRLGVWEARQDEPYVPTPARARIALEQTGQVFVGLAVTGVEQIGIPGGVPWSRRTKRRSDPIAHDDDTFVGHPGPG